MPKHNHDDNHPDDRKPESQGPVQPEPSAGYERSDAKAKGVVLFLIALSILAVLTGGICYLAGKAFFARMAKQDQPQNKWTTSVDVRQLGNMANNPDLRNKMAPVTQQFPTPRLQTDDGSQDTADLHNREDLLLENYSWADQAQGKVRIPIERAMELIAQSGLPVTPTAEESPLLYGDSKPVVIAPLTKGFARTGYELDEAQAREMMGKRVESQKK
jgi:hypothetical protein